MQQNRNLGFMAAVGCYVLWGILPLYWHLMAEAEANEILCHRILWSVVFMLIVLVVTRRWKVLKKDCRELWHNKKRGAMLVAAAVIISLNWLTYIWAVNHNHVIDTSIGYYINPLVNVLFGVAIFGETLSAPKKLSIALAAVGIFLMTWQIGKLPWVSVALALTFGSYGALKKKAEPGSLYQHYVRNAASLPLCFLLCSKPHGNRSCPLRPGNPGPQSAPGRVRYCHRSSAYPVFLWGEPSAVKCAGLLPVHQPFDDLAFGDFLF